MKKIKEFQKEYNLVADGILGYNTISKFKQVYNLNNFQVAHFLGQLHHETAGFTRDTESLNYSPTGLINTFSYYRNRKTEAYIDGRTYLSKANQKAIANKVYADQNRSEAYKLGNTQSNDGWNFIGRGAIQLTGYNNYASFGEWMYNFEILFRPELVATKYYWKSAIFFFETNNIWSLCNNVSEAKINSVTRKINKSTNSYKERVKLVQKYYSIIK